MNVTVRLFATLREGRGKELSLDLPEGSTPASVAERLGIGIRDIAILLVNGRDGKADGSLAEGDRVSFFPPVGGG